MSGIPASIAQSRHEFLALVAEIRPELHRYCARITGSVIDGEDVVQDVLAKAFYELSLKTELPPLRPWLFRVAHNRALDFCRRYERKHVDSLTEISDDRLASETIDPGIVRAALASFLVLPPRQRSAVVLKDVLGFSLEEVAEIMETSVLAVKAALSRGRAELRERSADSNPTPKPVSPEELAQLHRYVALFNARDWDGIRALLAAEVELDIVSQASRRGPEVGQYFGRYATQTDLRLEVGLLEGRPAIAVFSEQSGSEPAYFMLLEWAGSQVREIRDFRYVPYIAEAAIFEPSESFGSARSSSETKP